MKSNYIIAVALLAFAGCVSYDEEAANAINALSRGEDAVAIKWAGELVDSAYSSRLGMVEMGRVQLLGGNYPASEACFRKAIDSAIDRNERDPIIKLGDMFDQAISATVTDDRTIEYYLSPYELNLALEYGIMAQLFNGHREDALVDARLSGYVQDKLADEYGADLAKRNKGDDEQKSSEMTRIMNEQSAALDKMIANTRNSWENATLWWLTGLLFEADGDMEAAVQSYRRAAAINPRNMVFAEALKQGEGGEKTPNGEEAKLAIIIEDGFVPRKAALKIPLRIYATISIDIPIYANSEAYAEKYIKIDGVENSQGAALGVDVRALAARNLKEDLPGIIIRNITRAAVNAGVQAAGKQGGGYVQVGVEIFNLAMLLIRSADTRSWVSLPDAQYVWCNSAMRAGEHKIVINFEGRTAEVNCALKSGETKLIWVAFCGSTARQKEITIGAIRQTKE